VSVSDALETWLAAALARQGAFAGTIHLYDAAHDVLRLAAAVHIPEPVLRAVATIPRGKGMAGLAWERRVPVQTCNLQTDDTGDVRPGARAVDAQAAVALPVFDRGPAAGLRAVVGFAFRGERAFTDAELARLTAEADGLPT
jgi:L-methionine (R)-S-oxide reductase